MSNNGKRPVHLDLQLCYSGFKVEELEYIDYSRTSEDPSDQFLDNYSGKPSNGTSDDEVDEEVEALMVSCTEFISREDSMSYRCSTPTERRHRGFFSHEVDLSGFQDLDSGIQTRDLSRNSIASIFGEDDIRTGPRSSVESFAGGINLEECPSSSRRKIELSSNLHEIYRPTEELDLSIEEEMSHNLSSTSLRTLKRRLSFKFRRHISTGLFGSYISRPRQELLLLPPTENAVEAIEGSSGQPQFTNKPPPPGPLNLLFRKFRNRHFI